MVTINSYKSVARKDGSTFITLELTGGIELVQSSNSGSWYATVRKCRIPSTFDANIAKMMVGQQLDGEIVRVQAAPYDYVSPTTGEVMTLQHTYAYRPAGSVELIGHVPSKDLQLAAQ